MAKKDAEQEKAELDKLNSKDEAELFKNAVVQIMQKSRGNGNPVLARNLRLRAPSMSPS